MKKWHVGTVVLDGYPRPVWGLIDPEPAGDALPMLMIAKGIYAYAPDTGDIVSAGISLDDYMAADDRNLWLGAIAIEAKRMGETMSLFEALNVLAYCLSRQIGHENAQEIRRVLPVLLAGHRELIRQLSESHADPSMKLH